MNDHVEVAVVALDSATIGMHMRGGMLLGKLYECLMAVAQIAAGVGL